MFNLYKIVPSVLLSKIPFWKQSLSFFENLKVTHRLQTNFRNYWVCLLIWDLYCSSCQDSYNMFEILSDHLSCNWRNKFSCYYRRSNCFDLKSPRYFRVSKCISPSFYLEILDVRICFLVGLYEHFSNYFIFLSIALT